MDGDRQIVMKRKSNGGMKMMTRWNGDIKKINHGTSVIMLGSKNQDGTGIWIISNCQQGLMTGPNSETRLWEATRH